MRHTARVLAGVMVVAGVALPVQADEDKFTAADVLGWDQKSQDWYFEVATGMAAVLATQNQSPHAGCIDDWYFRPDNEKAVVNDDIRTTMARFSEFHPTQILVAIIEKQCGSLTFIE